ncbi:hypothetical protein BC834DRAFT_893509 [Gloeopeniophorella convolvens]|nr:hypothetical protein BC834DRAFT_893509 [Gloeopeniophorella convolvens]
MLETELTGFSDPPDAIAVGHRPHGIARINDVSSNVLLEIFDLYRLAHRVTVLSSEPWPWHRLAHVCSRWRQLLIDHLGLLKVQHRCVHPASVVTDMLAHWLPLPITIDYRRRDDDDDDDLELAVHGPLAAFNEANRVVNIFLERQTHHLYAICSAMQKPAPNLEALWLKADYFVSLPSTFLSKTAPRLRSIQLCGAAFFLFPAPNLRLLELDYLTESSPDNPTLWSLLEFLESTPQLENFILRTNAGGMIRDVQHWSGSGTGARPILLPNLHSLDFIGIDSTLDMLIGRMSAPHLKFLFLVLGTCSTPMLSLSLFMSKLQDLRPTEVTISHHMSFAVMEAAVGGTSDPDVQTFHLQTCETVPDLLLFCSMVAPVFSAVRHLAIKIEGLPETSQASCVDWRVALETFREITTLCIPYDSAWSLATFLERSDALDVVPRLRRLELDFSHTRDVDWWVVRTIFAPFLVAREAAGCSVSLGMQSCEASDGDQT